MAELGNPKGAMYSTNTRNPFDVTRYRAMIDEVDIEEAMYQVGRRLDVAAAAGDGLAARLARTIRNNPRVVKFDDLIVGKSRRGGVLMSTVEFQ